MEHSTWFEAKRKQYLFLLVSFFFLVSFQAAGQCTLSNLNGTYCADDTPVTLTGGTTYYGPGVAGSLFTPANAALAGPGPHRVITTDGTTGTYTYSAAGSFSPYVLTSPTQISLSDDSYQQIPIGFVFSFFGNTYTDTRVFDNGFIRFGAATNADPIAQLVPDATSPNTIIAAAWSDLDPSTGLIQYQTIGTAPLRVLVVEYINVRFFSNPGDYVATQIQLYETSNIIEIHSSRIGSSGAELKTMGIENSGGTVATPAAGRNKASWTATSDFASFIPSCTDRKFVTINPVPLDKPVSAITSTSICQGGTVTTKIQDSQIGTTYQLRAASDNSSLSSFVTGTGGDINITSLSLSSNVTIKVRAVNISTSCDADMLITLPVTVNLIPIAPVISPATPAAQCQGAGNITLTSNTPAGTLSYQWYKDGLSISGANSISYTVIDLASNSGSYAVTAIGAGSCASSQSSAVNIAINALPSPAPTISPNSVSICSGTSTTLTVNSSQAGINYQVFKGASPVSGVVAGTGGAILITTNTFTSGGTLSVRATNPTTLCFVVLATTAALTINPLPTPSISGSNSVCVNQAGVVYTSPGTGNSYLWSISGGVVTLGQGTNTATVTWGAAGAGTLQLTETIPVTLCTVTTSVLNVTINPNPAIPSIIGVSPVCTGQAGATYSTLAPGPNYNWSVTNGAIVSGLGTNTITVNWNSTGGGGNVNLTVINATGCAALATTFPVTFNPAPSPSILGINSVCENQTGVTYSTAGTGNQYNWVITGGIITAGQLTNSITVDWGPSGSGTLRLTETIPVTLCSVTTSLFSVSINAKPAVPVISGPSTVCAGQTTVNYSTTAPGPNYNWSVANGTIASGLGTNTITVDWNATGGGGAINLTVTSTAGCSATALSYPVAFNPLPTPLISGLNSVCSNQNGVTYSTPSIGNTYLWTITNGSITSAPNIRSIIVNWGPTGTGTLQLTETLASGCSTTTPLYSVTINPNPTPSIGSAASVCANAQNIPYSTTFVTGRSYAWSVISGGVIDGPSNGSSINVDWGPAGAGAVQVTETILASGCATTSAPYPVTINPNPTPSISGPTSVCQSETDTYSSPIVGLDSYFWAIVGGTITSGQSTNSITVDWGLGSSGTVQLTQTAAGSLCPATTPLYNVIIKLKPTPTLGTPSPNVCANTNTLYSTPFLAGRTYQWFVTGGSFVGPSTNNSVTIKWGVGASGTVSVRETLTATGCQVTTIPFVVTINPLPTPAISGATPVCVSIGIIYSTSLVPGNVYSWALPLGGGIITPPTSNPNLNQVTVTWNTGGARNIQVTETNPVTGCTAASSLYNVNVNAPSSISGSTSVCANQSGVIYSVPFTAGRTYSWTVIGAASVTGGTTNIINVSWGSAGPGTVQLTETITAAACSTTTPVYNVTIKSNPTPAISGPTIFCANQSGANYFTTNVGGHSYTWTVTGGTITSGAGTNSINVSWGIAGTGTVSVTETFSGCAIATVPYNVSIVTNPTPSITGNNTVCENQVNVPYSTPSGSGRTYVWNVAGGSIVSGIGTNAIIVNWGSTGTGSIQLTETITSGPCSFTTPVFNVNINPRPTPSIIGLASVCANQAGVGYSTANVIGNNYIWSLSGGSIFSGAGTSTITVDWGISGPGNISVTEISGVSGCITTTAPLSVTLKSLPSPAITGSNSVCANDQNKVYSTPAVAGSSYTWLASGGTIDGSSTNNNVLIDWGPGGPGTLQVTETSAAGCTVTTPVYNLVVNSIPTPAIAGLGTVCANQAGVVYSTSNVTGDSYLWTVSGGSILSGFGTNSIIVNWNNGPAGSVSLIETTSATGCSGLATPLPVSITPNPTPGIVGDNSVCANELNKTYSTTLVGGNTYSWSVAGGTISGSSINNAVVVDWGAAGAGAVTLMETNALGCVSTTPALSILINPTPTPVISGATSVCANQTGSAYTTPGIVGDFYSWNVTGGSISSGSGTNTIVVNWGTSGPGTVNVTEFVSSSGCAVSPGPYSVSINPVPAPFIAGNNTVCANDINKVYSTALVAGHTYSWIVTGGAINGSSTGNSIVIDWGSAGTGTVLLTETITASNCSITTPVYTVNINNLPTPAITGLPTVCALQTGVIYSTPNVVGNSYTWSVSGGSIVSGAGSSSIVVNWGNSPGGSITVTEFIPSSSCLTTSAAYPIVINPIPSPFITGNNSVCANGSSTTYSTPFVPGNTYGWSVTGGTISGPSNNNSISINWGSSGTGTLSVTETAGCSTSTPIYSAAINPSPIPLVSGPVTACANQSGVVYSTPNVIGNAYSWSVSGGSIVSGVGTNSISITWGSAGTGVVILTESVISSGCAVTTSPVVVAIGGSASISAGADAETCTVAPIDLGQRGVGNIASGNSFASLAWSGGTGTFSDATILNPVYTPGAGESGVITLSLTAVGIGFCPNVVDYMQLTVTPVPSTSAGSDAEICQGSVFGFFNQSTPAAASNTSVVQWTQSGGTGTLFNSNILAPTYQPGIGESGIVTFTLTAISTGSCASVTDNMQLSITQPPTVNAGTDASTCAGVPIDLGLRGAGNVAVATNFSSLVWSGGSGSFSSTGALNPIYSPGIGETGTILLTLKANPIGSCAPVQDQVGITINQVMVDAGSFEEICSGNNFSFAGQSILASASNYSALSWTHNGLGTLINPASLTPVYQPSTGETGIITFTLSGSIGTCAPVTDVMQLTIRPAAVANAGTDSETCAGTVFNFINQALLATASNFVSLQWTHSGSGTLTNSTTLSPIYTPGAGETGNLTFTLTATGNGSCIRISDQMILRVTPAVIVDAGSNVQICQGNTLNLSIQSLAAVAFNYASVAWTHAGLGVLFNTNSLSPTYVPTPGETGNIVFILNAFSTGSCISATDIMTVNIVPSPAANAGDDAEACEGSSTFDFSSRALTSVASNGSVLWSHNGAGSLSSNSTVNPVYNISPADYGNIVLFTMTVTSGFPVCAPVQDGFSLKVNRKAVVTAPADYTICQPPAIGLVGNIGGTATTALWSIISGNGTLSSTNISGLTVTANYNIDPSDIGSAVVLRITTNDPDGPTSPCTSAYDDVGITINRAASLTAGIDLAQCQDQPSISLNGSIGYAPNGVAWTGGLGSFSSNSIPTSTYNFSNPAEISSATPVVLTLTANDPDGAGPCLSVSDQMLLKINPLPIVNFSGLPSFSAENGPVLTLTGNQTGGIFTISPPTSNIGSTVPSPTDKASFDPSAVTLGLNAVKYSYSDLAGCSNTKIQSITVNPITVASFKIQKANFNTFTQTHEVCANQGDLLLTGQPDFNTFGPNQFIAITPGLTINSTGPIGSVLHKIPTDGLAPGIYYVNYQYTNASAAVSDNIFTIEVFPGPNAVISSLANNCIASAVQFTQASTVQAPASIVGWNWDFGNSIGSNLQSPNYQYTTAGNYSVKLTVTTSQSCVSTTVLPIQVGEVPQPDFIFSGICSNDFTQFEDKTTKVVGSNPPGISTISTFTWDFGDGNVLLNVPAVGNVPLGTHGGNTKGTFNKPLHKYTTQGTFTVVQTVNTSAGCAVTITQDVIILISGGPVTPDLLNPYSAPFETSTNGWVSEGLRITPPGTYPIVKSVDSWLLSAPSGTSIASGSGSAKAWWTGKNISVNGQPTYFNNESSTVNGPCFDLQQLKRPMIALDYWSDTEKDLDGAAVQYSTDGGLNWFLVGPLPGLVDRDQGINWYNGPSIAANPGQQPQFGPYGWTNKSGKWERAAFNLDMVPSIERDQVRIRVVFASNSGNAIGNTFDGFAFDNVYIGEKTRNVLVEHFTNSNLPASVDGDTWVENLYQDQIALRSSDSTDFRYIQYHIGFPSADPLNVDNPGDPAARSLYFGVSQPPTTIMDGIVDGVKFKGKYTDLNRVEIDRRALKYPLFDLQLQELPTSTNNVISVKLVITARQAFTTPLIAQVALVEKQTGTFKNVLRKQLLGSDGEIITIPFTPGLGLTKQRDNVEINVPITDGVNLLLVGYVQDKNTKEIYQSIVIPATTKAGSVLVGIEDPIRPTTLNGISVYPNPAKGTFYLGLPDNQTVQGFAWKLIDQRGITLKAGIFDNLVNYTKLVDVSELSNGLYFVMLSGPGGSVIQRKIVVMN